MTSDRAYSPAIAAAEALAELRRCAGTQFDPRVVEAFAATLLEATVPVEHSLQAVARALRRRSRPGPLVSTL